MTIANTPQFPRSAARGFFHWWLKAWEQAGEAEVIASLDETVIRRIAGDCGIDPDRLVQLAKSGPDAADEMLKMMRALNIDPIDARLADPLRFRDMEITCSKCAFKGECRRDLAKGQAPQHFVSYCDNADILNGMRAEPALLKE